MKILLRLFICFAYCSFPCWVEALDISSNYTIGAGDSVDEDVHISGGGITIKNYGDITGNITVDGFTAVSFQNAGTVSGNIQINSPATVNQIIESGADLNFIGNLSGHNINVQAGLGERLDFVRLLEIGENAHDIIIQNTSLVINRDLPAVIPNVILNNQTIFYVDYITPEITNYLASNISTWGSVQIISTNPLYTVNTGSGGLVRQTQYGYVLRNSLGEYLDTLRTRNPNDKLLMALDSLDDVSQMDGILSQSVKIHPLRLMSQISVWNTFSLQTDYSYMGDTNFGLRPFYIFSHETKAKGLEADFTKRITKRFVAKAGISGGVVNYDGAYDDVSGYVYGANFGAFYQNDDWFARASAIISGATFDNANVFDGNVLVASPTGLGAGLLFDAGPVFKTLQDFLEIKPFVGFGADYSAIVGVDDTNVFAKLGFDTNLELSFDNNFYGYGFRVFAQSNGALFASLYLNMVSVADGIGGDFDFGVLHQDGFMSYKLSLKINFQF